MSFPNVFPEDERDTDKLLLLLLMFMLLRRSDNA